MADVTKLNAAIATLSTDVTALIAAAESSGQPAVDAATAALTALDGTVTAETAKLNPA